MKVEKSILLLFSFTFFSQKMDVTGSGFATNSTFYENNLSVTLWTRHPDPHWRPFEVRIKCENPWAPAFPGMGGL